MDEDIPLRPTALYGACKVLGEFICGHCSREQGLEYVAPRPSAVYGFGRVRGGFTFGNDVVLYQALGKPTTIPYVGEQINWISVKDVAWGSVMACFAKKTEHNVSNLGGDVYTLGEAAD